MSSDGFARSVEFKTRYLEESKMGKSISEVRAMEDKDKTKTQLRCALCGAEFDTQEELDAHNKDVHPGQ